MSRIWPGHVFIGLVAAIQSYVYWPSLPAQVASHFGTDGQPDAWMSKQNLILLYFLVLTSVPLAFVIASRRVINTKDERINIPNKDYWLSPERRDEALQRIVTSLNWIGIITSVTVLVTFNLVFEASANPAAPHIDTTKLWIMLGATFVALIATIIPLVRGFQRPPSS